jgi:hypothetical protein
VQNTEARFLLHRAHFFETEEEAEVEISDEEVVVDIEKPEEGDVRLRTPKIGPGGNH